MRFHNCKKKWELYAQRKVTGGDSSWKGKETFSQDYRDAQRLRGLAMGRYDHSGKKKMDACNLVRLNNRPRDKANGNTPRGKSIQDLQEGLIHLIRGGKHKKCINRGDLLARVGKDRISKGGGEGCTGGAVIVKSIARRSGLRADG